MMFCIQQTLPQQTLITRTAAGYGSSSAFKAGVFHRSTGPTCALAVYASLNVENVKNVAVEEGSAQSINCRDS